MCDLSEERVNADLYELDFSMAGNLAFAVSYQEQTLDKGITLHVFESSSTYREIIRFDCFMKKPHFHYNYSDYDHPMQKINKKSIEDSFLWACDSMLIDAEELFTKSKAKYLMKTVDFDLLEKALEDIKVAGLKLLKANNLLNTKS